MENSNNSHSEHDMYFATLGYFGLLFVIPLLFKRNSNYCRFHAYRSMSLFIIFAATVISAVHFNAPDWLGQGLFIVTMLVYMFAVFFTLSLRSWKLPLIGAFILDRMDLSEVPSLPKKEQKSVASAADSAGSPSSSDNNKIKRNLLSYFVYCIWISLVLTVYSSLITIQTFINSASKFDTVMLYALVASSVVSGVGFVLLGLLAIQAFKHQKPNAVALGKMYVGVIFATHILSIVFSILSDVSMVDESSYFESSRMVVKSLIFAVGWFCYLTFSEDVLALYPKDKRIHKKFDLALFLLLIASPIVMYGFSLKNEFKEGHIMVNIQNYFASESQWKEVRMPTENVSISFPRQPKHEVLADESIEGTNITIKEDAYQSTASDGNTYIAVVYRYSSGNIKESDRSEFLHEILMGIVESSPGNELVSSSYGAKDSVSTTDFVITNSGEKVTLKGRLLLNGMDMYKMILVNQNGQSSEENYNKFINSFKVLPL